MLYNDFIGGGASPRSWADKSEAEREAPSFLVRFRALIMGQAGYGKLNQALDRQQSPFLLANGSVRVLPTPIPPAGLTIQPDQIGPDLDQGKSPIAATTTE